jgi:hypothetical protein
MDFPSERRPFTTPIQAVIYPLSPPFLSLEYSENSFSAVFGLKISSKSFIHFPLKSAMSKQIQFLKSTGRTNLFYLSIDFLKGGREGGDRFKFILSCLICSLVISFALNFRENE